MGSGVEDEERRHHTEPVEGRRDQGEKPHAGRKRDEGNESTRNHNGTSGLDVNDLVFPKAAKAQGKQIGIQQKKPLQSSST